MTVFLKRDPVGADVMNTAMVVGNKSSAFVLT